MRVGMRPGFAIEKFGNETQIARLMPIVGEFTGVMQYRKVSSAEDKPRRAVDTKWPAKFFCSVTRSIENKR